MRYRRVAPAGAGKGSVMTRKLLIANFAAAAVWLAAADGIEYTWIGNGESSWSAGGNWRGPDGATGTVPGSNDTAVVTGVAVATDADAASVKHLARVRLDSASAKIVWNVQSDLESACAISGAGSVEKIGPGTMRYTCKTTSGIKPDGGTTISNGMLVLPDYANDLQYNASTFGRMTVNAPGVLYTCCPMMTHVQGLWGDGTVTNAVAWQLRLDSDSRGMRSQFSGTLAGALRVTPVGNCDVLSTNSANTGAICLAGGKVGVMKVGNGNSPGSLGNSAYEVRGSPAAILYLGQGETASRTLSYGSGAGQFTFDAGETGGIVLSGTWASSIASMIRLILDGGNTNTCVMTGGYNEKSSGGVDYATHLTKKGTGTWKLQGMRNLRGAIAVENGTLQFDSLEEAGVSCSLGLATVLHSAYHGAKDESKAVDYAVLLGTPSTEGVLEYMGNTTAFSSTRPIAVHGKGRLKNNADGPLAWGGVSNADTTPSELVLETDRPSGCRLQNVSDGVGKGPLSIRKQGSGQWTIAGHLSFTGGLTADEGVLRIAGAEEYSWYRWFAMKRWGTGDVWVQLQELGFFDENGKRINAKYTYNQDADGDPAELAAGEWAATMSPWVLANGRQMKSLVDDNTTDWCIHKNGGAYAPSPDNRSTWIGAMFHMTNGSPAVASFDYVNMYGSGSSDQTHSRSVIWSCLEASTDGVFWRKIGEVVSNDVYGAAWQHGDTAADRTYSANSAGTATHHGFPVTELRPSSSLPDSVAYVSVAPGAAIECAVPLVTAGLRVDVTRGGGKLEKIVFAENGTLEVTGLNGSNHTNVTFELVGCSGTENVKRWDLLVDGERVRNMAAGMSASGTLSVFPVGSVMIIR